MLPSAPQPLLHRSSCPSPMHTVCAPVPSPASINRWIANLNTTLMFLSPLPTFFGLLWLIRTGKLPCIQVRVRMPFRRMAPGPWCLDLLESMLSLANRSTTTSSYQMVLLTGIKFNGTYAVSLNTQGLTMTRLSV